MVRRFDAVLFDMDGVLVDAQQIHRDCLAAALPSEYRLGYLDRLPEFEARPTSYKLQALGISGELAAQVNKVKQDLTLESAFAYPFDARRNSLLRLLTSCGVKTACVTNSIRRTAEVFLSRAGCPVDVLVAQEDVSEPKPSPDGYLYASDALAVPPDRCLIVEDSDVGIEVARRSMFPYIKVNFNNCVDQVLSKLVLGVEL